MATHEQAAAEMAIDSIREQIRFIQASGSIDFKILVDSISGSIAIYDKTRANLKEIDDRSVANG